MPNNLYLNGPHAATVAHELAGRLNRPLLVAEEQSRRQGLPIDQILRDISRQEEFAIVAMDLRQWPRGCRGQTMNSGLLLDPAPEGVDACLEITAGWRRKLPYKTAAFRELLQQCAKSSAEFGLFADGDRILAGVSGGEDSLMLMHLLAVLQRRLPFRIEVIPALIDMGYDSFDARPLIAYCEQQGWQLQVDRLEGIPEFFSRLGTGDKPCSACSRLRRGRLHNMMSQLKCNKLALGHHLDDLCTSFMIALFRGGGLKTMAPNTFADGGKARLIRPLWNCRKRDLHAAAQFFGFPVVKSCPYEDALKDGDRHFLGSLLQQLEGRFPDLYSAMRHSMGDIRLEHLLDHRYCQRTDSALRPDT